MILLLHSHFYAAMKTKEERKAARAAIEAERRRSMGEQAYRDWLRTSKNKPLPVPLNQGELSKLQMTMKPLRFNLRQENSIKRVI